MSSIVSQQVNLFTPYNLVATVVKLTAATDSVSLPRMRASSNSVVQLRRPGDVAVTVSQTNFITVTLTGTVGSEVLLISLSDDPITNPVS